MNEFSLLLQEYDELLDKQYFDGNQLDYAGFNKFLPRLQQLSVHNHRKDTGEIECRKFYGSDTRRIAGIRNFVVSNLI